MPTFHQGNMWSDWDTVDYFCITTNSFVKNNGALVMGAGIAKTVRNRFPGIDKQIGQAIVDRCGNLGIYHFLLGNKICAFQVKQMFNNPANTDLIKGAVVVMGAHARSMPDKLFALNFPGIGNGKLAYEDVRPLLEPLPDNVRIWTF